MPEEPGKRRVAGKPPGQGVEKKEWTAPMMRPHCSGTG